MMVQSLWAAYYRISVHSGPEEGFYGSRGTCISLMECPVLEAAKYLIPMKRVAPKNTPGLPSSEAAISLLPPGALEWLLG